MKKGTLSLGADGDVTVIDPDQEWEFRREETASRSLNNPFYGWPLKGRAVATIVAGKKAWIAEAVGVQGAGNHPGIVGHPPNVLPVRRELAPPFRRAS
jgi:dihydroorotase-like cyclic amidohydrolase